MRWGRLLAMSFLLLAPTNAAAVGNGGTAVFDRPSGFGALPFDGLADSNLGTRTMSADGCFVVFQSDNDVTSTGDENDAGNIFRRDRCLPGEPIDQVNTSASGAPSDPGRYAEMPSISANGRYVAFVSDAPSLGPAANGTPQVWVKDMNTGAVELASRADGASGQLSSGPYDPVISGDGTRVAFTSDGPFKAANAEETAAQTNVYVRDLAGDKTYMASVTGGGTPGGGVTSGYDISFDGTAVAFVSQNQLVAGDTDSGDDAYLARSVGPSPTQTLVSYAVGNTSGAQSAGDVALSSDGKWVAWLGSGHPFATQCNPDCAATPAYNLDFGLDASVTDGQTLDSISFGYSGTVSAAAAPTDVFWTTTAALTAGDTNGRFDLYSHLLSDLTKTGIERITDGTDAQGVRIAVADDGGALAMFESSSPALPGSNGARNQIYFQNGVGVTVVSQPADQPLHLHEASSARLNDLHSLAPGAHFAVFSSDAPALGMPFMPGGYREQIFRRDLVAGTTTPVSVSTDGAFANGPSYQPSVSAAGDRVAFQSLATNLAPLPAPNFLHVYVRDVATGITSVLDRTAGGTASTNGATSPEISANGKVVVFVSASPDLPGGPGGHVHVYAADVDTGAVTLVDATATGTTADDSARAADVSADGNRVAFVSLAGNLGGSSTGYPSVYVKDRTTGAVTWVSRPQDGSVNHNDATDEVSISEDGQHVAFVESDAGFGYGANSAPHVFLHDLGSGTTQLASLGTPLGTGGVQRSPALSADGHRMTFIEDAYPGHPRRAYLRDLSAGTTTALENGAHGTVRANIDASGACTAFTASTPGLSDPGYPSPDYEHAYVRAFGADCPPPPPGGGPGPGGGSADTTAPTITGARLTNKRFRVAARRTAVTARRAKRGTTFVFTLSEAARTTIAIAQRKAGRRKGKRCVAPRKGLKKRCTRFVAKVTLTRTKTKQGGNRVAYTGRTAKGTLKPGRYRATLRATDAAGNRSKATTLTFTIVRR